MKVEAESEKNGGLVTYICDPITGACNLQLQLIQLIQNPTPKSIYLVLSTHACSHAISQLLLITGTL